MPKKRRRKGHALKVLAPYNQLNPKGADPAEQTRPTSRLHALRKALLSGWRGTRLDIVPLGFRRNDSLHSAVSTLANNHFIPVNREVLNPETGHAEYWMEPSDIHDFHNDRHKQLNQQRKRVFARRFHRGLDVAERMVLTLIEHRSFLRARFVETRLKRLADLCHRALAVREHARKGGTNV